MGCDLEEGSSLSSPEGGSNLWFVDVLMALLMAVWVTTLFVSRVRIFQANLSLVFSATTAQYPFSFN